MNRHHLLRLAMVCALAFMWFAPAGASVRVDHVTLDIALEKPATPGTTVWAAVRQTIDPGWHTYWRNPGDTGLATSLTWSLPKGVTAGEPFWPVPERFSTGPIVNFGYRDTATLLVPLMIARHALLNGAHARVKLFLLECAESCIPEQVSLDADLAGPAGPSQLFTSARAALPRPFPGPVQAAFNINSVVLRFSSASLTGAKADAVRYFPSSGQTIDIDRPVSARVEGGTLTLKTARLPHTEMPQGIEGVLAVPGVGAFAISATPNSAPTPAISDSSTTFIGAIVMALLGGMILNLMPCVLPILSMKALALAQSGGNARSTNRDGALYFAGVQLSFLAIAGALLLFEAGGAALGWGFQLQSPLVVFVLALLMSAIGLNLLGVFEVPLSLAGVGHHLTRADGGKGAFFTGVLAVLVASPCTAPLMGTAVGFALTQPPMIAMAVFAALGTGFALPFSALAFAPPVVRLIPKPGAWMLRFREFLAFPMFATAIWLTWVLGVQIGPTGVVLVLSAGLCLAFILWLLPHMRAWPRRFAGIAGLGAIGLLALQVETAATPDAWHPWSAAAVSHARSAGRPVLVDFSAAWCVTCLVNERVALANEEVLTRLKQDGVVLLKGDWTNRDPEIAAELNRYGRGGVPLYLLYRPGSGDRPVVLPQVLTPGLVLGALERIEIADRTR